MATLSIQFILLNIVPHVSGCHKVRILVFFVTLTVWENNVARVNFSAVNFLEGHCFLDESIKLGNHLVPGVWFNVPLSESVSNFTKPCFTSDNFWVYSVVCYNVHIVPPAVKKVVIPVMMHSHFNKVHRGQVTRCSRTDHLPIVNNSKIWSTHGI